MKALVKKSVIAASIAAAMLVGGAASAATANPFDVVNPSTGAKFTADKISGLYQEVITFNTGNTFDVALLFQGTSFNMGTTPLGSDVTNLGYSYGLYATYYVSGTYTTGADGVTTFNFLPNTGNIQVWLDNDKSLKSSGGYVSPTTGTGQFSITNQSADTLLASGKATNPSYGSLQPLSDTCGPNKGINCGSFGSTTTLGLTTAGSSFFVSPTPFYDLSFQSGVLTNFTPIATTQTITGELGVVFGPSAVPEPASLGLLGLGLLGLGVARRRKQNQA